MTVFHESEWWPETDKLQKGQKKHIKSTITVVIIDYNDYWLLIYTDYKDYFWTYEI